MRGEIPLDWTHPVQDRDLADIIMLLRVPLNKRN
jgi:hypothetical protein